MTELSRLRSPRSGLGLGSQTHLRGSSVIGTRKIVSSSQTPLTPHSRISRHPLFGSGRSKQKYLQLTEQRIFGEVVGLVDEIDSLKTSIREQIDTVERLQRQRPDIGEKVRFHTFSEPLNNQQCLDLEEENIDLERKIAAFRSQRVGTLAEVLRMEREQYEELKNELTDSASPRTMTQKISQLKESIAQLEQQRSQTVQSHFPEFRSLREENEILRQKTAALLQGQGEEWQMLEYLRQQEASRAQFMTSLQQSKTEFARLTRQNQDLRRRIGFQSKENTIPKVLSTSPKYSSSGSGAVVGRKGRRSDRLREYESFLSMVQQH